MSCLCKELQENKPQEADSKQTAGTCLQVPAAGLNTLEIQPDDQKTQQSGGHLALCNNGV